MANKFGKFLLCTAAIGTAAAAAYYYFSKKDSGFSILHEGDEDYDDFSDDLDDDTEASTRSYVALNIEGQTTTESDESDFTPLAKQVAQVSDTSEKPVEEPIEDSVEELIEEPVAESVEEFFDEDDDDIEEEITLQDME